jgi:quercetin dioxygenase-like cupin family protein
MTLGAQGYALARDEGQALWFFNGLFTVKAGGPDTRDAFTLIEAVLPAGGGAPPHVHHNEEEGFYVLEGELSITCGDQTWTAVPGSFAMLPRNIPHSFIVASGGEARFLQITSPAQFERFAAEMGEPAKTRSLPEPVEVDVPKLLSIVPRYSMEMLPPLA